MALFIGDRRGCFGLRRWTPVHGARRQAASVRGGEGDGGHAATVGERDEHRIKGGDDEHSAPALLGWPDLARARCGELRRRRVPGWN